MVEIIAESCPFAGLMDSVVLGAFFHHQVKGGTTDTYFHELRYESMVLYVEFHGITVL